MCCLKAASGEIIFEKDAVCAEVNEISVMVMMNEEREKRSARVTTYSAFIEWLR